MSIIRTSHDRDNPYFMLNRAAVDDERLSFKAVGIHTYLMSKPDNWTIREADLAARHKEGTAAVRTAIAELRAAGYITSTIIRDESTGRISSRETVIHEVPTAAALEAENPHRGKSTTRETHAKENPRQGKPTPRKTADIVSNDSLVNKESLVSTEANDQSSDPIDSGPSFKSPEPKPPSSVDHIADFGPAALVGLFSDEMMVPHSRNTDGYAARILEDYDIEQIVRGSQAVIQRHRELIKSGKRGITYPIDYLHGILANPDSNDNQNNGSNNGRLTGNFADARPHSVEAVRRPDDCPAWLWDDLNEAGQKTIANAAPEERAGYIAVATESRGGKPRRAA